MPQLQLQQVYLHTDSSESQILVRQMQMPHIVSYFVRKSFTLFVNHFSLNCSYKRGIKEFSMKSGMNILQLGLEDAVHQNVVTG